MESNDINGDWKDEAPLLASVQKENPFTVPEAYFDGMHQHLQSRIIIENAAQGGGEGFAVPVGYFEGLEDDIISSVMTNDIKVQTGESGFSVPNAYFDTLQHNIIEKTKKGRLNSIKSVYLKWGSYAAAACVVVAIGIGFLINQQSATMESKLSQIPDDEIVNYLQVHSDTGDFPVIIENSEVSTVASKDNAVLSEQEIEQYLESTL